jgi:hypothetical protein
LQVEPEERPKSPDTANDVTVKGLLRQILDTILGAVASTDVNTRVGIGYGFGLRFVRHVAGFLGVEFGACCSPERSILAGSTAVGCAVQNRSVVQNVRNNAVAPRRIAPRYDVIAAPQIGN